MFAQIPRWALALGLGGMAVAGTTTLAIQLNNPQPACVSPQDGASSASACVSAPVMSALGTQISNAQGELSVAFGAAHETVRWAQTDVANSLAEGSEVEAAAIETLDGL